MTASKSRLANALMILYTVYTIQMIHVLYNFVSLCSVSPWKISH